MLKLSPRVKYILSLISAWSIIALLFTAISYSATFSERQDISLAPIISSNFVRFGIWGVLFHFIFRLTEKLDSQKTSYWKSFGVQIILGILFSAFHFVGYTILYWLVYQPFREHYPNILTYLQSGFLGSFYLGVMIYAIIVFASLAYLRNKKFAEEQQRSTQLQSQLVQSQLQALKMQLQPHFLFNTLNSISSLVIKNPPQAQTMIAKLGEFLRLTLDFNESQMVLLSEELRFLRSYLEIEQIRFSEKLQVIFSVNEEVRNAVVPHLILQPIVENSVKHGISQITEGGKIEIIAQKSGEKLFLQIKDNGTAKPNPTEQNKMGLANIKNRLKHIYGDEFSFEMNGGDDVGMTVTILIPLTFDFTNFEKNDE